MDEQRIKELIAFLDDSSSLKACLDNKKILIPTMLVPCLEGFDRTCFTAQEVHSCFVSFLDFIAGSKFHIENGDRPKKLHIGKSLVIYCDKYDTNLGPGIYKGKLQDRWVEVKHITDSSKFRKELANLIKFQNYPNIVQFLGAEEVLYVDAAHSQYKGYYICSDHGTRLCHLKRPPPRPADYTPPETLVQKLKQLAYGLKSIHDEGCCHGNLSPQSITAVEFGERNGYKISNLDMCQKTESPVTIESLFWPPPEFLTHKKLDKASDIYNLGRIFYLILTGGGHPFGVYEKDQEYAIRFHLLDLSFFNHLPEVLHLLNKMLARGSDVRPTIEAVLKHPFFWKPVTHIDFLYAVSEQLEVEWKGSDGRFKAVMAIHVVHGNWTDEIEPPEYLTEMEKLRYNSGSYNGKSNQQLLRFIRNTNYHKGVFLKYWKGKSVEAYFQEKFKRLVIDLYDALEPFCRNEDWFKKIVEEDLSGA